MNESEQVTAGLAHFSDPTLLLIGSSKGLHALVDFFNFESSLASSKRVSPITSIGIELKLHLGALRTTLVRAGNQHDWFISSTDAKICAELVLSLAESTKPSHTYLDVVDSEKFEIIVSKDEYEPTKIFEF